MTATAQAEQPATKLLYRMADLPAVLGISKTEIYRQINAGRFPKGTKLSPQVVVWKADDVRQWVDQLVP